MKPTPKKEQIIEIAKELKEQIATQTEIESQVFVHIHFQPPLIPQVLRVWSNTYLRCKESGVRCKMLFSENIAVYPQWTRVEPGVPFSFALIFENLPKKCLTFDLIEEIPEEGGFVFKDIERNSSNVYNLKLL